MHQTRSEVNKKIPIRRKGTKYVASSKMDRINSVPVVIAVRDMLKLARTLKEVEKMIHQKLLKINGQLVKDHRYSVRLFNILQADKHYKLTLNNLGKFAFEEDNSKERLCKVINKTLYKKGQLQLNLHEGTNILSKEKINVDDSVYIDFSTKIKKHVAFEKGKKCFIISGKYSGHHGTIKEVLGKTAEIALDDKSVKVLTKRSAVVI